MAKQEAVPLGIADPIQEDRSQLTILTTKNAAPSTPAMLFPPEALLVLFKNCTKKELLWARMKHHPIYNPLPCPDNCWVTVNWHLLGDLKNGWTARIMLFNWDDIPFEYWYILYSFSSTQLNDYKKDNLPAGSRGVEVLDHLEEWSRHGDPSVPEERMVSFKKRHDVKRKIIGDGHPAKVTFNGEEWLP